MARDLILVKRVVYLGNTSTCKSKTEVGYHLHIDELINTATPQTLTLTPTVTKLEREFRVEDVSSNKPE